MTRGWYLDQLEENVEATPRQVAVTWINGPDDRCELDYQTLWSRAATVAAELERLARPGQTAALVYPSGTEFAVTFLGCLMAGLIAVPCSPPRFTGRRLSDGNQISERFFGTVRQSGAKLLLTETSLRTRLKDVFPVPSEMNVVATDEIDIPASMASRVKCRGSDVAFLQFTSGSSGRPRGVIITHANLAANQRDIQAAMEHDRNTTLLSWLPLFHDMGLVGGLLQPLFVGGKSVLLPHTSFAASPYCWLKAVTDFRATTTGAPNFAFELAADRITSKQKQTLDLSSLKVVFNGSEPVSASTVRRFSEAFTECGLEPEVVFPCFGMAEATLMVSGGPPRTRRRIIRAEREELEQGHVCLASDQRSEAEVREIVSCGPPVATTTVRIVDPSNLSVLGPFRVGEICIAGPSVSRGYFCDSNDSTTHVHLESDADTTFLRTGDLGFIDEQGELYVTGRQKDVIIVAGRNVDPSDVERVARDSLQLPVKNRLAAVGIPDRRGTEQVALIVECDGELRSLLRNLSDENCRTELNKRMAHLRQMMVWRLEIQVGLIALLRSGQFPTTSSGKTRRSAARQMLLSRHAAVEYVDEPKAFELNAGEQLSGEDDLSSLSQVKAMLRHGLAPSFVPLLATADESTRLEDLGVDSLGVCALATEVEAISGNVLAANNVSVQTSLGAIAELLAGKQVAKAARRAEGETKATEQETDAADASIDSGIISLSDFSERESIDVFSKTREFRRWYDDAEQRGFKRYLLPVHRVQGGRAIVGADAFSAQKEVVLFASADYLGLAQDPRVKDAAATAIQTHGCNVASVPLVAGSTPVHQDLEARLASLMSTEACVLFPTGHSANMAAVASLCSPRDYAIVDNRVHYSILEGLRLARCKWLTFHHNDVEHLGKLLQNLRKGGFKRGILVVLEGVYGIDGDLASLDPLLKVAHQHGARVLLDDAHGIGVLGATGAGTTELLNASDAPDIVMGSLSKAIGSFGGFLAGPRDVIDYLRFYAKSISFAVGLPAANAAAALAGLDVIQSEPERRRRLLVKSSYLRRGLRAAGFAEVDRSKSPIMSVQVGDEEALRKITRDLYSEGVWAEGLPFPAVARGEERLRFRVRDAHQISDLDQAVAAVGEVIARHRRRKTYRVDPVHPVPKRTGWTVAKELTAAQAEEVFNLSVDFAKDHGFSLPWVSREFAVRYFCCDGYWAELADRVCWYLAYDQSRLVAAFRIDVANISRQSRRTPTGLVGQIYFRPGYGLAVARQIRSLAATPYGCDSMVAPANFPVPLFGTGIQPWMSESGKPFLESSMPRSFADGLITAGFRSHGAKRYYRLRLASDAETAAADPRLEIRGFRRAAFADEIKEFIAPILSETIAELELCGQISRDMLVGVAGDLRDMIMPGLWHLASWQGEPAGFLISYPNVRDEFLRIAGEADVADVQAIQEAMDEAREAFIAWVAVKPDFAGQGISRQLLVRLHQQLLDRGFTHVWVSWEFVDGDATVEDGVRHLGKIVDVVQMPYYELPVIPVVPDASATPTLRAAFPVSGADADGAVKD